MIVAIVGKGQTIPTLPDDIADDVMVVSIDELPEILEDHNLFVAEDLDVAEDLSSYIPIVQVSYTLLLIIGMVLDSLYIKIVRTSRSPP